MQRITFGKITSAGYDALRMKLELEFRPTGRIIVFLDVPEEVWYGLKNADSPDRYFQRYIQGRYLEERL